MGEAGWDLLIFLFALLLALLLDIKLRLFPLFFITFVFLSNVTHDDYSFLVGLALEMTNSTFLACVTSVILPLVLHSVNNLSAIGHVLGGHQSQHDSLRYAASNRHHPASLRQP